MGYCLIGSPPQPREDRGVPAGELDALCREHAGSMGGVWGGGDPAGV
jgi:hypothetical protein